LKTQEIHSISDMLTRKLTPEIGKYAIQLAADLAKLPRRSGMKESSAVASGCLAFSLPSGAWHDGAAPEGSLPGVGR
jgi:hypothetical protein